MHVCGVLWLLLFGVFLYHSAKQAYNDYLAIKALKPVCSLIGE